MVRGSIAGGMELSIGGIPALKAVKSFLSQGLGPTARSSMKQARNADFAIKPALSVPR